MPLSGMGRRIREKKKKEGERDKSKEPVMHNRVAHHPLTDDQPIPNSQSAPFQVNPPLYLGMAFYGIGYPSGLFGSAIPAMLPSSFLFISSLAEHETPKSPGLGESTTKHQPKHQCVIDIILIMNPKQSAVPAIEKKMTFIPAEMKTEVREPCP